MNVKELLPDSAKITGILAADIAMAKPEFIEKILLLAFSETKQYSMRAANTIEIIDSRLPELIKPYYEKIIQHIPTSNIDGVKRCLLKIFTRHLKFKNEETLCALLNLCFDSISSPTESLAVKIYAIDIVYQISNKEPDLKNELILAITDQLDKNSVAFANRGNKILKKLYKETR